MSNGWTFQIFILLVRESRIWCLGGVHPKSLFKWPPGCGPPVLPLRIQPPFGEAVTSHSLVRHCCQTLPGLSLSNFNGPAVQVTVSIIHRLDRRKKTWRVPNLASRRCFARDLSDRQSLCCQHLHDWINHAPSEQCRQLLLPGQVP